MGWVKEKLCKDGQAVKGLVICRNSDDQLRYALEMTKQYQSPVLQRVIQTQ